MRVDLCLSALVPQVDKLLDVGNRLIHVSYVSLVTFQIEMQPSYSLIDVSYAVCCSPLGHT